ncbi:cytochrome p450, partial [Trifolium pratense]
RNNLADWVCGFAHNTGQGFSFNAVLCGAMAAIEIAHRFHWHHLWIETDSSLVVKAFKNDALISWKLRNRYIREEEVSNLVKSIFASEGSVVNLTDKILSMTYGITMRAAFVKILQRVNRTKTKIEKVHREIDMILQDIIDDHKSVHKEANKDEDLDLVDVLLKIQQENDQSQLPLTDDNLKSIIQ